MTEGRITVLFLATVAFGVGVFFRFHWDAALALSAVWAVGLLILTDEEES